MGSQPWPRQISLDPWAQREIKELIKQCLAGVSGWGGGRGSDTFKIEKHWEVAAQTLQKEEPDTILISSIF